MRSYLRFFILVGSLIFATPQSPATECNVALDTNLAASYRLLTWMHDRARCVPQFEKLIKMHSGSLEGVVRAIHSVLRDHELVDPGSYNTFEQWCEGAAIHRQKLLAELHHALPDQFKNQTEQGLDQLLEIISIRNFWTQRK